MASDKVSKETGVEFLRQALSIPEGKRKSLLEALDLVEPAIGDGLFNFEIGELAEAHQLDLPSVEAIYRLLGLLGRAETQERVAKDLASAIGELARDASVLLGELKPIGIRLGRRFERVKEVEAVLPSFRGVDAVCDLRLTSDGDLHPTFILRIDLDEGEPCRFQCSAKSLVVIRHSLEQALERMEKVQSDRARTLTEPSAKP